MTISRSAGLGPGPDSGSGGLPGAQLLIDQPFEESDLVSLRSAVAAHADDAGLPEARAAELVLIAHELAINAVLHGGGRGRLRLWVTGSALHIQVTDSGPGFTDARLDGQPNRPVPGAPDGRGLWLVRQFSDHMSLGNGSARRDAGGASVIASVRLTGDN